MISSDTEFLKFALSNYDNPVLSDIKDFESDLKRFTYINMLLNRYRNDKLDLKERLIINHLIILGNCFSIPGMITMLDFKIQAENKYLIGTFLHHIRFIEKTTEPMDNYLLDILHAG
jgi:hypothetical protein